MVVVWSKAIASRISRFSLSSYVGAKPPMAQYAFRYIILRLGRRGGFAMNKIVVWLVGGGIFAAAGAAWATLPYEQSPVKDKIMTYDICIGQDQTMCQPRYTYIGCQRWDAWAKRACGKYVASQTEDHPGGTCGYHTFHVECIDE